MTTEKKSRFPNSWGCIIFPFSALGLFSGLTGRWESSWACNKKWPWQSVPLFHGQNHGFVCEVQLAFAGRVTAEEDPAWLWERSGSQVMTLGLYPNTYTALLKPPCEAASPEGVAWMDVLTQVFLVFLQVLVSRCPVSPSHESEIFLEANWTVWRLIPQPVPLQCQPVELSYWNVWAADITGCPLGVKPWTECN